MTGQLANLCRSRLVRVRILRTSSVDVFVLAGCRLMKALVWPVATYGCESWILRKNEETRLEGFEMKGLRKILRVSWTA